MLTNRDVCVIGALQDELLLLRSGRHLVEVQDVETSGCGKVLNASVKLTWRSNSTRCARICSGGKADVELDYVDEGALEKFNSTTAICRGQAGVRAGTAKRAALNLGFLLGLGNALPLVAKIVACGDCSLTQA